MPLHPLKKNGFVLCAQIATVEQTKAITVSILDAMLAVKEDEKIPAGLRQVGRSAITDIKATAVEQFDAIIKRLKALHAKCESNLTLPEVGEETDLLDAAITGEAISQMGLVVSFGALVFKALEHLPKLNKQAPAELVTSIITALNPVTAAT